MESGEDTHSIIRVRDTCDNAALQQNREISVIMSDSLHRAFWSLETKRRSLAAMLMPTKTTPDTAAVQIRDQQLLEHINMA